MSSPYGADHAWIDEITMKSIEVIGGDPTGVAQAILTAVDDPNTPVHVLVGDDAAMFIDLVNQAGSFEAWIPVAEEIFVSLAGRP